MRKRRVAIIGAGPAGLFTAEGLVGKVDVTIFERGDRMSARTECRLPELDHCPCETCAILEGDGGAGGMSDGKLTFGRGTQGLDVFDPATYDDLLAAVGKRFVELARSGGIPYRLVSSSSTKTPNWRGTGLTFQTYPLLHFGTEGIRAVTQLQILDLVERGVKFVRRGIDDVFPSSGKVAVQHRDGTEEFDAVVIATGLAGTGWSERVLRGLGATLVPGHAGFGLRVEAPAKALEPAFEEFYDWKLVSDDDDWQVRTFCCNQRGFVVNENHRSLGFINVNGHSYLLEKKSQFSNFALILRIAQTDEISDPPEYVRTLARGVNDAAGGTAVQTIEEFLRVARGRRRKLRRTNHKAIAFDFGRVLPKRVHGAFARFILALSEALPDLLPNGVIYAPEAKYYGYRIAVDRGWQVSGVPGVYVVGNASGYLDSHVACAVSGIEAARNILGG
ncbi:MAG: hypothetical protein DRO14_00450 [Thermoprotei archaeon]|nr:MAG: hypothetical protein DRO14_00450 [Thermoprotei archaeon]